MNETAKLSDSKKIFEIAKEMEILFEKAERIFCGMNNKEDFIHWQNAVREYNKKLSGFAEDLARLTKNDVTTIRKMIVKDDDVIAWTPGNLKNVARYESWNTSLWSSFSGIERPPTWTDRQILRGATEEYYELVRKQGEKKFSESVDLNKKKSLNKI